MQHIIGKQKLLLVTLEIWNIIVLVNQCRQWVKHTIWYVKESLSHFFDVIIKKYASTLKPLSIDANIRITIYYMLALLATIQQKSMVIVALTTYNFSLHTHSSGKSQQYDGDSTVFWSVWS